MKRKMRMSIKTTMEMNMILTTILMMIVICGYGSDYDDADELDDLDDSDGGGNDYGCGSWIRMMHLNDAFELCF